MHISEIVENMVNNLIDSNHITKNAVINDILKNESILESYSMDELSQLVVDTFELIKAEKSAIKQAGKPYLVIDHNNLVSATFNSQDAANIYAMLSVQSGRFGQWQQLRM